MSWRNYELSLRFLWRKIVELITRTDSMEVVWRFSRDSMIMVKLVWRLSGNLIYYQISNRTPEISQ